MTPENWTVLLQLLLLLLLLDGDLLFLGRVCENLLVQQVRLNLATLDEVICGQAITRTWIRDGQRTLIVLLLLLLLIIRIWIRILISDSRLSMVLMVVIKIDTHCLRRGQLRHHD